MPPNWTTPEDIEAHLSRLWERGKILAAVYAEEGVFPLRIPCHGPSSRDLSERFTEVQVWITHLQSGAARGDKPGYRLERRTVDHRVIGTNTLPAEVWVDSPDIAAHIIRKGKALARFRELLAQTRLRAPRLLQWLGAQPLRAIELEEDWPRLLDLVAWYREHPCPGIYVRQLDLPGIHTKFLERHRGVLTSLLDLELRAEGTSSERVTIKPVSFEARFGFREKPRLIRMRLLDVCPHLPPGLTDLTFAASELAGFDPGFRRVFIAENEVTFLAFPPLRGSLVIFGAGYGFDLLDAIPWLHDSSITYWGDIDTHGFGILDQLRAHLPHARSLLMDEDTLLWHRALWSDEKTPTRRELTRLTPSETALYDGLRTDRWGKAVRLEQERISFSRWMAALAGQ